MSSITERITQFVSPTGKGAALAKNDNDVVIVSAVRTAITKVRERLTRTVQRSYKLSANYRIGEERWIQVNAPGRAPLCRPSRIIHHRPPETHRPGSDSRHLSRQCLTRWGRSNRSAYGSTPRWYSNCDANLDSKQAMFEWVDGGEPDCCTDCDRADRHWDWCVSSIFVTICGEAKTLTGFF